MLTLHVRYTLSEYLAVIEAFMPYALTAKKEKTSPAEVRHPTVQASWLVKKSAATVASIAFFYKVARIGDCKFTFSEAGLEREAKDGRLLVPWPEVKRVFRLPTAFLFAKSKGAMPIPYSSISERERALLEQLLAKVGHGSENAA